MNDVVQKEDHFNTISKNFLRIEINERTECIDARKDLSGGNKLINEFGLRADVAKLFELK